MHPCVKASDTRAMAAAHTLPNMKLCEWTAAAVAPDEGPPTADEWVTVDSPHSPTRFAGERAVAYRTTFSDPRDGDGRALLCLHGLYAHARVWLNDEFLGRHDTYFTPFRSVFEPREENELVVECRAPEDRFGGVLQTSLIPAEESVPGIRWDCTVEPVPTNVITDLTVRPDKTDETGVNAIVTIDAGSDFTGRIRLSLRAAEADGMSALSQVGVNASAGERLTVQGQLSVHDPDRWWPRGFGPQNRYVVRAALGESERTTNVGFRTVEYRSEGLSVNGTRIPLRGRVSLPVTDSQSAMETIERAVETNANLVRWYGHAPPKTLYDAADEAGVLLCQDVPLSSGALDAERARLVVRTLAGEYGHHPSLTAFCVNDDAYEFDATTDVGKRHVLRATGESDRAATATAAATALPNDLPVFPTAGLDADGDNSVWVLDGYSGAAGAFDTGAHTRHVISGTDAEAAGEARRAIEELRCSNNPVITVSAPPNAETVEESLRAGFEPVGVFLDDPTATEPCVVVVNDTPEPVTGELDWTAGFEGDTLSVDADPLSRTEIGDISVQSDTGPIELSLSVAGRTVTNRYRAHCLDERSSSVDYGKFDFGG